MGKPRVVYFPIRARAEPARLCLELAGVEYENQFVEFADWPKVKPTLPFKQVPVYYDDKFSDSPLAQSNTIARYIARQHGLYGSDPATDAQIDQVVDAFEDLLKATTKVLFANKDDWKEENFKQLIADLTPHLENLEALLQRNKDSDFWVGNSVSLADVAAFAYLDNWINVISAETLSKFPALAAFRTKFRGLEKVAAYISSDRRPKTTAPSFLPCGLGDPEKCK